MVRWIFQRGAGPTARERHCFVAAGLLFVVAILSGTVLLLRWERTMALDAETERGKLLTAVLASHVSRSLSSVDNTFDTVASLLEADGGRAHAALQQRLHGIVQGSTFLRSVTVLDLGGTVMAASRAELIGSRIDVAALGFQRVILGTLESGVPLAARDLSAAPAGLASSGLVLPRRTGAGMSALPFARAATAGGRQFVMLAMVHPGVLLPDYRAALGSADSYAAVFDYQGRVLGASANAPYLVGGVHSDLPMFEQLRQDREFGRFQSGLPGSGHAVNFRAARRFPLVAVTAMSHAHVLAAWRDSSRTTMWMGIATAGFVLLYTLLLDQVMRNREIIQHQLQQAKEAAEQANAARGVFLSTISHEIRTPLNAVIGMSNLLGDTGLDAEQRGYVKASQQAASALLGIIDDVLDFSRIDAGKLSIDAVDCDVRALVEDSFEVLAPRARLKGLSMSCVVDPALPARCTADPVRLRQILFNLLGNAIKFTGSGAIALSVRVSEQTFGCCMVRCEISDSGIGIRPDAMTMLFRPFTQADGSVRREYGGSGLGLSICKKLVELMDGSIGVESALGRGSTFWFELPLAVACGGADMPAGATPAPVTASPARHGQPDAHAPILLVEDNQMNQIVAVRQLQLCGYSVDVVHNGQEALAAMKARSYALVLMDCQMPVMDGWETTRRIRQAEAAGTPRVQIVAMTANAMRGDRERCLEAGMDDYIAKPIMRDQLAAMLGRRLLGGTAPPSRIAPASMDAGPRG